LTADRDQLKAFRQLLAFIGPQLQRWVFFVQRLFGAITFNSSHLLHRLLPSRRDTHYSLRPSAHYYVLSIQTTALSGNNYITKFYIETLVVFDNSIICISFKFNHIFCISGLIVTCIKLLLTFPGGGIDKHCNSHIGRLMRRCTK